LRVGRRGPKGPQKRHGSRQPRGQNAEEETPRGPRTLLGDEAGGQGGRVFGWQ